MLPDPSEDLALFPEPPGRIIPPEPEQLTAGEKMRRRQAARIVNGYHPLGEPLRLHPDASRDPEDRTGPGPRCGGCRWRELVYGGIPKCLWGEQQVRDTRSETSDVRAWWPACVDFEPREET